MANAESGCGGQNSSADKNLKRHWDFYEKYFSVPRMKNYLHECSNDKVRAAMLYEWNAEISASFLEILSFLEVALRNRMSERLLARHIRYDREGNWTEDPGKELGRDFFSSNLSIKRHKFPYTDIEIAVGRIKKDGALITAEQIISELNFGFWFGLVLRQQSNIWPDLASGFTNSPNRRRETISDLLAKIKQFRNRVGHHHRIWHLDLQVMVDNIYLMAYYIDEDFSVWLKSVSRVELILTGRP